MKTFVQCLLVVFVHFVYGIWAIADELPVVPKVKNYSYGNGEDWTLPTKLTVGLPADQPLWQAHVDAVGEALKRMQRCEIEIVDATNSGSAALRVQFDRQLSGEEYALNISAERVHIRASSIKGLAHATATLIQLLGAAPEATLPPIEISDEPDSGYRSLMMDLGRNPHSVECLKETIDLAWYYKLDSLHLHLTDDQRFAFPTQAFPKLVTDSAKISWEQFAAIETYAAARGVSIVPELEVPGHSSILTRVYPEVFGENPTEVATLESSRMAIKRILDEMVELFPSSPYIHIGGDEASGVPVEHQRNLINELHAHLRSRGKQTIVWEGPGRGEDANRVNSEVIHINWNTTNYPPEEMLAAGHRVINATWDPLYVVDHYPRNNFTMASPEYIFRNLDLFRFAHFDPGFPTFARPNVVAPNDSVIGFCMCWWEGREENFVSMLVPRIIPMADVAWNAKQTDRDFSSFESRAYSSERTRQQAFYPVSILAEPLVLEQESVFHKTTKVSLTSRINGTIRFTLDGSLPTTQSNQFDTAFPISAATIVRAAVFENNNAISHGSRRTFVCVDPVDNLALGKTVTPNVTAGPLFSPARLTDGGIGNLDYFLGYPSEPKPIEITIDLGTVTDVNQIVTHAFFNGDTFESYVVEVSADGKTFETVADRREKPESLSGMAIHDFPKAKTRFIRIVTSGCKGYVFDSFSKLTEIQAFLR